MQVEMKFTGYNIFNNLLSITCLSYLIRKGMFRVLITEMDKANCSFCCALVFARNCCVFTIEDNYYVLSQVCLHNTSVTVMAFKMHTPANISLKQITAL